MNELITVNYFRYRSPEEITDVPEESLGSAYMAFVIDGEITYHVDGSPVTVSRGEALYLPCGVIRRRDSQPSPAKYYSIQFTGGDEADTCRIATVFNYSDIPGIMWCISMIERSYVARYYNDTGSERRLSLLFSLLLNFCAEASSGAERNQYTDSIIGYIRENYKSKIRISDIARHVHLNPAYCSTLFRRSTGMTIGEFITKYRLDLARDELSSGSTVKEAGEAVGFSDPYNFSKWFHLNAGMPPSEFRLRSGAVKRRRK